MLFDCTAAQDMGQWSLKSGAQLCACTDASAILVVLHGVTVLRNSSL